MTSLGIGLEASLLAIESRHLRKVTCGVMELSKSKYWCYGVRIELGCRAVVVYCEVYTLQRAVRYETETLLNVSSLRWGHAHLLCDGVVLL